MVIGSPDVNLGRLSVDNREPLTCAEGMELDTGGGEELGPVRRQLLGISKYIHLCCTRA